MSRRITGYTCKCKRCRFKWENLFAIGILTMCPRCFCSKIRRWAFGVKA